MTSPAYTYRPKNLIAEYPALEAPARELGLLEGDISALAWRSNIDFRDRRELEDYASLYWSLVPGENEYYCNIHQVNDAASYYACQLRSHVRALAV